MSQGANKESGSQPREPVMSQGVSKVPGKQKCVREPAMSQAPCEPVMSQGASKEGGSNSRSQQSAREAAMSQRARNEPGTL